MQEFNKTWSTEIIKGIFHASEGHDKNFFLREMVYHLYRLKNKKTYFEIERRKNLSILNYEEIAQPLSPYPLFKIFENNWYGHGYVLSKIFPINHQTRIEHGLFFGDYLHKQNLFPNIKNIITFSEYRKKIIEKQTDKDIVCIGPYIHYADLLLNQADLKLLKEQFGKTLLIFPSHSSRGIYADFNMEEFIEKIEEVKQEHQFKTVIVCLYWKDIQLNKHLPYQQKGYTVVCSGFLYDQYFLSRMKTIIHLADVTLSNNIGTHIGYCLSENKPHWIISQSVQYQHGEDYITAYREFNVLTKERLEKINDEKRYIESIFSTFDELISKEQRQCVEYFWGTPIGKTLK
ncbi:MAG: hypothetical protein J6V99_08420 [Neisseriaceae bacterium]|nr:hypothetical protein [Neisseriaceae bacterium]